TPRRGPRRGDRLLGLLERAPVRGSHRARGARSVYSRCLLPCSRWGEREKRSWRRWISGRELVPAQWTRAVVRSQRGWYVRRTDGVRSRLDFRILGPLEVR